MRVSRLVKAYIVREVSKKFETAAKPLQEIRDKQDKECQAELKELLTEMNERGKAILAKYPELEIFCGHNAVFDMRYLSYKCTTELHQKITDLNKKKLQTIDDILISLELGGTKADLEKMLNEIKIEC